MSEFDFASVNPALHITKEFLLNKVGDSLLWRYYFDSFKLGTAYPSKFRRDSRPSTMFYVNRRGLITLKDFATEERLDVFAFVQKLYGLSYKDMLIKMAKDFGILKGNVEIPKQVYLDAEQLDKDQREKTLIQFIPAQWNTKNLLYWRFYEITQEELERERIFPIKKLFINHKEIYNVNNYNRYAYIVTWEENGIIKEGIKVLSPDDPQMKWLSSVPLTVVGDYDRLPRLDRKVFIEKSKKDKIIVNKLFTDTCWSQNEGIGCISQEIQQELLNTYEECYLVWGADEQGVQASCHYTPKGFKWFNTPKSELVHKVNDPAEYVKRYGIDKLAELFKKKGLL